MSVTEVPAAAEPSAVGPVPEPAEPSGLMTIGQLSAETGVPTSTIRFWERKGLLSPALRQSGQRRYTVAAVRGVVMLRLLQEVGLTLADIRRFREERAVTPRSWHSLVAEKLICSVPSRETRMV